MFCWENGTPPHPDTVTRRFKKLSAAAGLPEINLHDVRHSYATAKQMSGVAAAASFGGSGERALPAVQRAALEQARSHKPMHPASLSCLAKDEAQARP